MARQWAWIDEFPEAVVIVSPDGTILMWSRGASNTFGYPRDVALGRPVLDLIVPGDLHADERARLAFAYQSGAVAYESLRTRRDGAVVRVDVSIRAIPDNTGAIERLAIAMKDLSFQN